MNRLLTLILGKGCRSCEKINADRHAREKENCSTHFIRAVVLEKGVLAHLKYTIQRNKAAIRNDMVKRVYVHAPQIIYGKRTQQIDICYDLVGILPMSLLKQNSETA